MRVIQKVLKTMSFLARVIKMYNKQTTHSIHMYVLKFMHVTYPIFGNERAVRCRPMELQKHGVQLSRLQDLLDGSCCADHMHMITWFFMQLNWQYQ